MQPMIVVQPNVQRLITQPEIQIWKIFYNNSEIIYFQFFSNASKNAYTVNPLYNGIGYNSKIHYNDNLICTKISGSCIFSLTLPLTVRCYYLEIEAILTNTQNI